MENTINYLGFTVSGWKVFPDQKNIQAVLDFAIPTKRKVVPAFLGLTVFYTHFILNYAEKALPLTNSSKTDSKFVWTNEAHSSFDLLHQCLLSKPCLALPDFSKNFTLSTDASKYALGVLSQNGENGFPHPVAYASKKLKDAETWYSTIEKEMLDAVFGVTHFKQCLYGKKFTIFCDQASLSDTFKVRDPTSRIAHWVITLQQYVHKPGNDLKYAVVDNIIKFLKID